MAKNLELYCGMDNRIGDHDCSILNRHVTNKCLQRIREGLPADPGDPALLAYARKYMIENRWWTEIWICDNCGVDTTFVVTKNGRELCSQCKGSNA